MELLAFGHGGSPWLVFPTSQGRFFEFEDRGMIQAMQRRLNAGELRLICVDSFDSESWYNRRLHPRQRVERHMQYESYLLNEVIPLVRRSDRNGPIGALGCSFGGYHAVNLALRNPDAVQLCLSMGAKFDITSFLDGYYDQDCYFNNPPHFLPNMGDPWYLDRYRRNWYQLCTGEHDFCWDANEKLAAVMRSKGINHRLDVWGEGSYHDWPYWEKMVRTYFG
jgi:esterase/lipase superfamily enzyme